MTMTADDDAPELGWAAVDRDDPRGPGAAGPCTPNTDDVVEPFVIPADRT